MLMTVTPMIFTETSKLPDVTTFHPVGPNGVKAFMGRPKLPIEEEKVEELASVGCSAEEIASLLTPPGSKRPMDHRTIERRFAPTLKKGRHQLAHMLRSQLVRRAMNGDTAALIFACKTILGLRESKGDEFNVHVSVTATASAKPASFTITEDVKKKLYEAALVNSPGGSSTK
jgi:hypothetical protein